MRKWFQRGPTKAAQSKVSVLKLLALPALLFALLFATSQVILHVTAVGATAGDWPMYLHDLGRTGASEDTSLSPSNAGQLALNWSFKTGGLIESSPTVVGGTVYVGSWDGYEYALDATTGALKWKTYLGVTTGDTTCDPASAGVSSAAAVQDGVVYVGGGDTYWYALDAASGNVLWKVYTGDNSLNGGHYNWSSPVLYNGYAYIGIASKGDCPLVQGQLLQVSLSSHQVVNTFNVVPTGQVGGGIWASPSIDPATNTIYVMTGTENQTTQSLAQAFLALDASSLTLKDSWKLPENQAVSDSDFDTTPTLFTDAAGNPMVASINKNGIVYAFNRTQLSVGPLWSQQIAVGSPCPQCGLTSISSGAFGNRALYLAGGQTTINGHLADGSVRALDPASGKYRWEHAAPGDVFGALAYTNGLVIDGAGSVFEVLDATTGARLYSYTTGGTLYAAPSVAQGQIFLGGADDNVYAFGLPSTPPPTPTPDANCPSGWLCQDIGTPSPAGSETISGNNWSVQAGGTGIGGNADQFRFISQTASGDTQISAQVVSQQATSQAAQAGLMLRQSSDPASPYYGVFLTKGNGVVVQYRSAFGGATTSDVQMPTTAPPLYLEIQRVGDQFQAATSSDGVNYTLVPGCTVTLSLPTSVAAGVAVSSETSATLSTAGYSGVALAAPSTPPAPPPPTTPCPSGWNCSGIGNPALVGKQSLNGGSWSVSGAGTDIWNRADQFHYVWQSLSSDASIKAHILSQTNTSPWAKAGVMLRQSTDPGSPYYAAFMTPGNGIVVQDRASADTDAGQVMGMAGTTPAYLKVARSGSTYSTYTSSDGKSWTVVVGSTVTLSLSGGILAGLAVTSQNAGSLSTATFDTVSISATAPPPPTRCPSGWSCADIGSPTLAGSQVQSGGSWSVQGAGTDIWGTADQFHYAWQSLAANASIKAHVVSQTNTSTWAKAGVMLRQSTNPGSPYYAALVTPGNGIVVQYRSTQGGDTTQQVGMAGTTPTYLKVARSGNTYSTYTSSDGSTWTYLAGSSITLNISGSILAGLAVTSHNAGALSTVAFDTVRISTTAPPPPPTGCPSGWSCADIGSPALAGSQSLNGGTWTVQGAGGDIWGTSDQFHYIWHSLSSDGAVSTHILSQTNTDGWAKAGVMLRQSSDPGSAYYAAFVTPSNGVVVQYRASQGASAINLLSITGTTPVYLKVTRSGSTYSTYTSSDGTTWTLLAGSSVTLNMNGTILAGLAVTSHNPGALSTVTFDTVV